MGCDYYIEKFLYITFKDIYDTNYITLERNSGYFYDILLDEDDPKYNIEYTKMIDHCLSPSISPILIYENNQFINEKLEIKYKELIEISIKNKNKNLKIKIKFYK